MTTAVPPLNPTENWLRSLTIGTAASILVWASYYPGDSTAVEQGGSIGLTFAVLAWAVAAALVHQLIFRVTGNKSNSSWTNRLTDRETWIDTLPIGLAFWVFFSGWVNAGAFSSQSPSIGGDWRSALNEGWWWIAAGGYFVTMRRWIADGRTAAAIVGLLMAVGVMLAIHTIHQHFISLPQTARDFAADPEGQLSRVGIIAPAGSAARMIFENRLRDGGPTATFALANSLAGPLAMIAGAGIAMLFQIGRRVRSYPALTTLIAVVVVGLVAALSLTGSRGGVLSVAIAIFFLSVRAIATGRFEFRKRIVAAGVVAVVLLIGAVVLAGDRMSWAQAPATIQLRWQYWHATLAMVADRPWFGIGPGNYQLVYQAYRDLRAHELIAEPHNFWMETLACGGIVGGALLTTWLAILAWTTIRPASNPIASNDADVSDSRSPFRRRPSTDASTDASNRTSAPKSSGMVSLGVIIGAASGLILVWYAGITGGMLPDFEAHQFAIPIAIAVISVWFRTTAGLTGNDSGDSMTSIHFRGVGRVAAATGLVHLCFSGGWTVPGVAMVWWTLAAIAVGHDSRVDCTAPLSSRAGSLTAISGTILLSVLWFGSVRPVHMVDASMGRATAAVSRNRISVADDELRSVMRSVPTASDPAIWLATIENRRRIMVFDPTLSSTGWTRLSQPFQTASDEAVKRIGNDPVKLMAIAELFLHGYQVNGQSDDLNSAADLLRRVLRLSPTHQSYAAQAAEIAREQNRIGVSDPIGDPIELAQHAVELSKAGHEVTRILEFQFILPARPIGIAAKGEPIRRSASDLLHVGESLRGSPSD